MASATSPLFGKYRVVRQQDGGIAAAVELRLPTGDKNELRGLDVTRTFSGIWSKGGRVSPHANIGYEFWSDNCADLPDGTSSSRTSQSTPSAWSSRPIHERQWWSTSSAAASFMGADRLSDVSRDRTEPRSTRWSGFRKA